ncbi:MAG: tyrosine--tRNA ligase [Myxococcota bacterium]|nr:tyrosine--tRNA ligase [Myxococcota bacterium]
MNAIELLQARGFIQQTTDLDELSSHFESGTRTFYVGFDPTGPSLHVGHMVPVMAMAWLQRLGHRPIAVLGGGTALIGDPSGKDQTREMLTAEDIAYNRDRFREQLSRYLRLEDQGREDQSGTAAILIDNGDWLLPLNYVEFLRDIGRYFSINRMLSAEGTRQRLERDQGMSFIEFNYHLLQSYDFLVLHDNYDCTVQFGGDDQWFNILGGVQLIRKGRAKKAYAATVPLITTADGKKMGKTESGAVWLDADQLSPYDYYQYWINVQDADVDRFLKLYTFLELDQIDELGRLQGADIRQAKAVLAFEATKLAHGESEALAAQNAAKKVFSGQGAQNMPTYQTHFPISVLDAFVDSGLSKSKGEVRRLIKMGGARIGSTKITSPEQEIGEECIIWAGKKRAVQLVK